MGSLLFVGLYFTERERELFVLLYAARQRQTSTIILYLDRQRIDWITIVNILYTYTLTHGE